MPKRRPTVVIEGRSSQQLVSVPSELDRKRFMTFKAANQIFEPDSRYEGLCVIEQGISRHLTLEDHHAVIANIVLGGEAPREVRIVFDRARSALLYAWFDYELLVVAESQAFAAFELALRRRLNAGEKRRLSHLIEDARKLGVLSSIAASKAAEIDPIDALRLMRNALAHGTTDVHSPAMALRVLKACASAIDLVFQTDIKVSS